MPLTQLSDVLSKIAVAITTAAILTSFGLIAKMYHDIEGINRTHVRYEEIILNRAERFSAIEGRLFKLESDVRNLLIEGAPPFSTEDGEFSREQQNQLNHIMAALRANSEEIRRQNCFLAGGPSKRPLPPACRGLRL